MCVSFQLDEEDGVGVSDDLDYSVRIPLATMDFTEQERFWVIEGRLRREGNFDTGFGFTKDGPCRDWELDWSLKGDMTAQDIMDRLKAESIPFTVRVSVADPNMRD